MVPQCDVRNKIACCTQTLFLSELKFRSEKMFWLVMTIYLLKVKIEYVL